MIDDDSVRGKLGAVFEDVQYEAGAFFLVFQVRGVDEDELLVFDGEVYVLFKDGEFVFGVSVESYFAYAEYARLIEEFGDERHDFSGEHGIVGFLGVDAEPRIMIHAEVCCSLGFILGELQKVVIEPLWGASVKACPEGGFANGYAA